ncbi:MAG: hypothetical protein F6K19_06155 [Cyanothece sp. SIO1E1]|nr:hypothetical protein [Cyanothece sp. SIO1E1]
MFLSKYPELACVQIGWLIISGFWMLRRNDEIPLLISFLLFYVTGYRYWAVTQDLGDWVNLSQFGIAPISEAEALNALACLVLAQTCFLGAYLWRQRHTLPIVQGNEFTPAIPNLSPKIILFGLFCLPLVILVRGNVSSQLQAGRSLAFQVSGYLYQFPFVLIGIATLILCLWKFGGMIRWWHKVAAVLILWSVANLTFQSSGRFQLLGWLATMAVILSASFRPSRRLWLLAGFGVLFVGLFSLAGALRSYSDVSTLQVLALDRFIGADDANMLDGFVLLQRFFPHVVPYRFGMAHLEVLLRPIPRAIWPDKPAGGGYLAQAGLSDADGGFTIGISPTLFGDFYSEGGIMTMVILAILYGIALACLVRWTIWLHPFAGVLVRAMICSALVPILRGGDLAGIIAWLGMAFWPCFLVLWLKRKEFDLKSLYRQWYQSSMGITHHELR